MEELVRAWLEPRLTPGLLAALWHGPAARGFDDPEAPLRIHLIVTPEAFRRDWAGRRPLREVFRGQVFRCAPSTYEEMGGWRWDAAMRFEVATARSLWDADGRLGHFLDAWTRISRECRRGETLECYAALRAGWQALACHVRRGDGQAVALLSPLVAESGMRVYFAAHEPGAPGRAWLLPEFRRLAGPRWLEAVRPLLQPPAQPGPQRLAAARLVELARDEIHEIFDVSRGALDAWGQEGTLLG